MQRIHNLGSLVTSAPFGKTNALIAQVITGHVIGALMHYDVYN